MKILERKKEVVLPSGVCRSFTFMVEKGVTQMLGRYYRQRDGEIYEKVVSINAFRLVIVEVISYEGEQIQKDAYDFGYISARSGEMAYLVRQLQACDHIWEMEAIIKSFQKDAAVAMRKDAAREVKRIFQSLGPAAFHVAPTIETPKRETGSAQQKLPDWILNHPAIPRMEKPVFKPKPVSRPRKRLTDLIKEAMEEGKRNHLS